MTKERIRGIVGKAQVTRDICAAVVVGLALSTIGQYVIPGYVKVALPIVAVVWITSALTAAIMGDKIGE